MSKLTLPPLAAGFRSSNRLNENFDAIETALENTLSRDGTAPNQMSAVIDMNSNRIINLDEPIDANDAVRLTDVEDAIELAADLGDIQAYVDEAATAAEAAEDARDATLAALGTKQPLDADLTAIAALTSAANKVPYSTGAQTWALTDFTAFGRTLLAGANQAAFLAALGQIDSAEADFNQAGVAATPVTVQAKLRQAPVQPNSGEFGLFTNATVTTATLLAANTAAMADGRPVELSGAYTINGPITPVIAVDGAELNIILRDDVTITVDPASTAFNRVFYAESTTVKSHTIGGPGTLTIDCNDKAAAGIWLRHTAATTGGSVIINAPVHVKNVFAATGISNATGILVAGRYERIVMRSPTVEDVSRFDGGGAESSGITCTGFDGEVEMYSPVVRRVDYGSLGTGDADCIKCFGRQSGTTNNRREGSVRIYSPVLEDGQVRLYKDQCGDTIVYSPWGRRRGVDGTAGSFAASSSADFDFQFGGGLVLDAHVEYYKSATNVTPLGASHSVFAFQQLVDNSEMYAAARNTTIISDVAIPRLALLTEGGSASTTEVVGVNMIPVNGFTATMVTRGTVEFDASQVGAKTAVTTLAVENVKGPTTSPCIAYTSYAAIATGTATAGAATTLTDSGKSWTVNEHVGREVWIASGTGVGQARTITSNTATQLTVSDAWGTNPDATSVYNVAYSLADKLTFRVNGCSTTMAATGQATRAISEISGNRIVRFKSFEIGMNPGFRNYYAGWNFDVRNLRAGTTLVVATAANLVTNAPPWGTGADNGVIECIGLSNYSTLSSDTICKAFVNNATTAGSCWITQDGGANWGALN